MNKNILSKFFFLYLCLVPLIPQELNDSFMIMDLSLVLILGVYLVKNLINKELREKLFGKIISFILDKTILTMIITLAVMMLSIVVAQDKVIVIKESIRFGTYIALMFYIINDLPIKENYKYFINSLYYPAFIVSVLGIVQYITKIGIKVNTGGFLRIESTLGHPNSLGVYLVLLIFPLVPIIIKEKNKVKKIFFGITGVLMVVNIGLCWSRNAWIALAFGLVILSIFYSWKMLIALFIAAGGVLLIPSLSSRIMEMGSKLMNDGRIKHWMVALKMFQDKPITGVGNGNYTVLHEQYVERYPNLLVPGEAAFPTHNSYFKVLSELGILGFIPFMVMNCTVLYKLFYIYKRVMLEYKGVFIGLATSIIMFLQVNFLDNMWFVPKVTTIYWVFIAIIISAYREVKSKNS